ncbi:MAG: xanthine dehydrogenase family protein subunit M [Thermomicrobiales bacterium]
MKPFAYARAADTADALRLLSQYPNARVLAGGTNLIDLMREQIEQPEALVDITGLPIDQVHERPDGGLLIGALVTNTALAQHRGVRERFPMLAQAILFGASGQIRNMATVGGNLLQRTRCPYFYDLAAACNKRQPGAGCDAMDGFNRNHAVLGASEHCVAAHPSDLCVALAALDALIHVTGPQGERAIPFAEFYLLPGDRPDLETTLQPGELITGIEVPALPVARDSRYRKVRDRASYAFALVSVAAALDVQDGLVRQVRLALGGVAPRPWRAYAAERVLEGAPATRESFRNAAEAELAPARGLHHNAFKIELAKRTITSVLSDMSGHQGE